VEHLITVNISIATGGVLAEHEELFLSTAGVLPLRNVDAKEGGRGVDLKLRNIHTGG
jgi:hypothetical protein